MIKKRAAFTLIELLVVISIIGILAGMVMVSFTSSQRQARDTQRKSDLSQYRSSLESYANQNNGIYPIANPSREPVNPTLCNTLGLSPCAEDPENVPSRGDYYYSYISDAGGSEYVLWAKLEAVPSTTYWVVCSSGSSGKVANTPTTGNCPL